MNVSVVLFTSDLRLHDHPPLRAALDSAREIVPLFVLDPAVRAGQRRLAFLAESLRDLDAGLRERGGRLVLRRGDVAEEVRRVAEETGAGEVHLAADVSRYARRREERLRRTGLRAHVHDTVNTVIAPGAVLPAGSDHFAVFTPYHRRWATTPLRDPLPAPHTVRVPDGLASEPLPRTKGESEDEGGETAGRARLAAWLRDGVHTYGERRDEFAPDATSRLSPHLHLGTLSPVELVHLARTVRGPGGEAFLRQLAWRDFHRQVLAARPDAACADYRTKHDRWRTGKDAREDTEAWREGRTGYPIVDAAMRQLRHEGRLPGRGRLLAASFLTKTLYIDWRVGAAHFLELLVDGDLANNQLNWQWMAGTGTDSRPNRVLNPVTQAKRHDPDGTYVRRWVPELAHLDGPSIHEPWLLGGADGYPDRIVDLADGLARFTRARGLG
ncbi:deoxyribodipyrimidine photo-lyase [Streptomyces roseirectus]|uniref:Deoxyribodipyrimidine photo-lyase n=1 Tax=Streptomyces roseirectus TaxID=2768066 RepID=A0A7H0I779_9ACTN|nr:deoxyribodipyrimidine photo-lyase [Streptomyces roseirectus]QNP68645.1 deoxyribodipyrimidine photo-lyase [Streptomyces roseirectus]